MLPVAAAASLLLLSGCNYVVLLGYLIGGPPSIEPEFDAITGKSMTEKDVTVAVVCAAPREVKFDFDDIDKQIARYVSHRLNQNEIKVVNPELVQAWLDENSDWDQPADIGAALGVTYVIFIDLSNFGLYEENSPNLFRGRAEGIVTVVEMDDDGNGEKIFSHEITSKFPHSVPRSTETTTYSRFKGEYLSSLSDEIGRLFYSYFFGDKMVDAA
jgi:hypothetical protein